MYIKCAHQDVLEIVNLKPHPRNPNKHSEKQLKLYAKILAKQGIRKAVVCSKQSGFVVTGHGCVEAAKLNGWAHVPVDWQDFASPDEEYAHMVADNKLAELADLDLQMVDEDALKLGEGFDMDLLGIPYFTAGAIGESNDPEKHWNGMPEFDQEDKTSYRHVVVHFVNDEDAAEFFRLIRQNDTGKTKSIWFPPQERMDSESKRYDEP